MTQQIFYIIATVAFMWLCVNYYIDLHQIRHSKYPIRITAAALRRLRVGFFISFYCFVVSATLTFIGVAQ